MNAFNHVKSTSKQLFRIALFLLPSVAWSLIYQAPKLVLDVLLLWCIEPFLSRLAQIVLRTVWVSLCCTMLLLEWNIYPESYLFYLGMLPSITDSLQGLSVISTLVLLIVFIFTPIGNLHFQRPKWILSAILILYAFVTVLKLSPWGRENLVDLRLPALRAIQVAVTAGKQIGTVSVVGNDNSNVLSGFLHERIKDMPAEAIPQKILVILLESWGESSSGLHTFQESFTNSTVKVLQFGHTPFRGSTLPGEVRELCGRLINFQEIGFSGENCLPQELKKIGFRTTAYHGYEGFFYYRNIVYPALGFKDIHFRPQLKALMQCPGAFKGACDDVVADTAIKQLLQPGKQFVYMMSLTAHEPVSDEALDRPYVKQISRLPWLTNTQLINRALIQYTVQRVQAEVNNSLVWIYVAGDHNPPSASEDLKSILPNRVPYMLIQIRGGQFEGLIP